MIDKHVSKLKKPCRERNCNIKDSEKTVPKLSYYKEFKFCFEVDLNEGKNDIHPDYLCNKYKAMFSRVRTALNRGKC